MGQPARRTKLVINMINATKLVNEKNLTVEHEGTRMTSYPLIRGPMEKNAIFSNSPDSIFE
jgi:hypothetical protein